MGTCGSKGERAYLPPSSAGFAPLTPKPAPQQRKIENPDASMSESFFTCDDEENNARPAQSDTLIVQQPNGAVDEPGPKSFRPTPAGIVPLAFEKKSKPKVINRFDFSTEQKEVDLFRTGASLYFFKCVTGKVLKEQEVAYIRSFINLSQFANEGTDNFSPPVNMNDVAWRNKHIFMLNKASYILPGVRPEDVTPELLSSYWYQYNCQSEATTVWKDGEKNWTREGTTFRITKHIVKWLGFNITVQFRVSDVPREHLSRMSFLIDGLEVHRALLLERTKRDGRKVDSTKKVKSIYLMHDLGEGRGILVSNVTAAVQGSIPSFIAAMVDTFGSSGAAEVAETCDNTRKFFREYLKTRNTT
eukprot:Hpha_TRINITY_DN31768_c0_g1::TRINITY_DN31768_c0_g1_i1::g.116368::m.116368